jgi:aldehyde:ferredoxin oxidoreductase
MSQAYGWAGKLLWVNLSNRTARTLDTLDYGPAYIGGRGLAARLAWDHLPRGIGSLDPENLLMAMTGPLSGTTAPFSGRTTIAGLSPQGWPSEWFSRASLGGHWGPSLKYAGYDGLIVEGKADKPVTLLIQDDKIEFRDASHLWGRGSIETQKILFSEIGPDIRVLTIGQTGEKLSRIAIINTESESAAGQGGFGAVMGSKNLKAIAVRGTGAVRIADPALFTSRCQAIIEETRGDAPWAGRDLNPERVEKYKQRWQACTQQCTTKCAGGCRFYGDMTGPATGQKIGGQFHCVSNFFPGIPSLFYNWNIGFEAGFEMRHLNDDYGLNQWDLLLGIVPWLRLCQSAGLIHEFNGRPMDFDSAQFWAYFLQAIGEREGMGDALAEGGLRAPAILGFGAELARPLYAAWGSAGHWDAHGDRANHIVYPFWIAPALMWAVDVRDPFSSSHGYTSMTMHWSKFLNDRGVPWDKIQEATYRLYGSRAAADPTSDYEEKELAAVWHGHESVLKDSITIDDNMFPRILSLATPDNIARAGDMLGVDFEYHMYTAATGQKISRDELTLACERVFNLERAVQVRNFDRQRRDDETVIPYFEDEEWWQSPVRSEKMRLDRSKFLPLLEKYYRLRGWDEQTGRPTVAKLRQLGLADVAAELSQAGLTNERSA